MILTALISGTAVIQIQNAELASALVPVAADPVVPTVVDPPVVNPPTDVTPPVDPIKEKLQADGCNLNADPTATQHLLGTCKILIIGSKMTPFRLVR